ncbi:hypothetical protein MMF93_17785 [Streptomyces tubbatahanensis]|uniref:Lipoprotein n=1 Tax=Streptomyces tubbatahanensis TaxID=2923272 RepID=A0ABY3XUM2_9ACTN|nr:hypothetical protein [Streptomyces tubbatahanensis]UNS98102.1 hypothetical protein MMF93_17785 [Streptomyces tubbatahanensis]
MRRSRTAARTGHTASPTGTGGAHSTSRTARSTTVGALMLAAVSTLSGCMTVQGADDVGEGGTTPVGSRSDDHGGATEPEGGLDGAGYRKGRVAGDDREAGDRDGDHGRSAGGRHGKRDKGGERGKDDDAGRSADAGGAHSGGAGGDDASGGDSGSSDGDRNHPRPQPTGGAGGSGGSGGGPGGDDPGSPTTSPSPTPSKPDPDPSPTRTTASPSGSDTYSRQIRPHPA